MKNDMAMISPGRAECGGSAKAVVEKRRSLAERRGLGLGGPLRAGALRFARRWLRRRRRHQADGASEEQQDDGDDDAPSARHVEPSLPSLRIALRFTLWFAFWARGRYEVGRRL